MKKLLLLSFVAAAGHLFAETAIPTAYDRQRYDETVSESPFALATPVAVDDKKEDAASPLNNLFITTLTQVDGEDLVIVKGAADDRGFKLLGKKKNDDNGISVEKINWSDRWNGVSVVLRHGSETKEITFREQAAAVMAPQGIQGPGGQGAPGGRFNTNFGANRAAPGTQNQSIIPTGLNTANAPRGTNNPQSRRSLTPGAARGAGTQNISGGVPRPGGGGNYRQNGGGGGAASAPNTGGTRQRDRSTIRNGR